MRYYVAKILPDRFAYVNVWRFAVLATKKENDTARRVVLLA